jgi:hypothetical protein
VERDERVAEERAARSGGECYEGREVHVPQVEVLARGDVVELIPEIAVVSGREQVYQELDEGQVREQRRCSEER